MNKEEHELLQEISGLHEIPQGAYNIRYNGKCESRNSTSEIEINPKTNKPGIDIIVKNNVVGKSVHIPVILSESGLIDLVYNDFYIGDNSDVLIVAGCGIHNTGEKTSTHNGIHTFHIGNNCKVKYVEKHLGKGQGTGEKVLNPITRVYIKDNSSFVMETTQLGGVSSSVRKTSAKLQNNTQLVIKEKILTTENQTAKTEFKVDLNGENSSVDVKSRSVAKGNSNQTFVSNVIGKNKCFGHVECDGILCDNAKIVSTPKISAENIDASLVHEAALGKIAGEQLVKLETLGLSETEAENLIIKGFLS